MTTSTNIIVNSGKEIDRRTIVIPAAYEPSCDLLARFAAQLMRMTVQTKERREYGHYIPFSYSYGNACYGSNWHKVLAEAEETGLIERNHSFSSGRFCKSVRLSAEHRTGKSTTYRLASAPRYKKALFQQQQRRLGPVGSWLTSNLSAFELRGSTPKDHWDAYAIDRIQGKDFFSSSCDFDRFHTNYTCLHGEHRGEIELPGHKLFSIDIRNSQPLLLHTLALNHTPTRHPPHTPTRHPPKTPKPICHSFVKYAELVQEGTLYEFLLDLCRDLPDYYNARGWLEQPSKWNRTKVKKSFLVSMFETIKNTECSPTFRVLQEHFPLHAEFILSAKQDGHQKLAHSLQRLESAIVIQGVARWLMSNHPDVPILTIHDELIVPEELIQIVEDRLRLEFQDRSVTPSLEIKPL